MEYDVDMDKVINEIKKNKAKRVLLQLPDGLKPRAKEFVDQITKECDCAVLIWTGSCYGSCDLPQGIDKSKIDLVFHFGHTQWKNK